MTQVDITRRVILFLCFAIILSLSACDEPEDFLKIQQDKRLAKVKAGNEAYEARKFGDAIEAFTEASQYGMLDASTEALLEKAKAAQLQVLLAAGHQAMASEDYETAYKAFSDARQFSHDDDLLNRMDDAVTKAWKKAGAEICWMRVSGQGLAFTIEQQPEGFVPDVKELNSYCRSFKFRKWKPGMLSSLPPPRNSFGLDLSLTSFGDDAIDDLARFKNIFILKLQLTNLTFEGKDKVRAKVSAQWMGF